MDASNLSATTQFERTVPLWLGYALSAFFGFALSLLGPIMPFLAARLELSFTEVGYHFTALSLGALVISLMGDRVARRIGRRRSLIVGALIALVALPTMLYGPSVAVTLPASFAYGFGIGLVAQVSSAVIVIEAGQYVAKAYSESNIMGGLLLFTGPLLVGLVAASPLGWQMTAFLPLIFFVLLLAIFRGLPVPSESTATQNDPDVTAMPAARRLPHLYWVFGSIVFLVVAIEWLISSWGASYLNTVVGFEASSAALFLSVFPLAMVLGRLAGWRLLNLWPERRVMLLSLLWVLLAFPIYWLAGTPLLNVAGLFLIGLGVGNLAPLSIAGAMLAGAAATDRASARLILFPSTANLLMLQLMGILSDRYGIQQAYTVEMLLIVVAIAVAVYAYRAQAAA